MVLIFLNNFKSGLEYCGTIPSSFTVMYVLPKELDRVNVEYYLEFHRELSFLIHGIFVDHLQRTSTIVIVVLLWPYSDK